MAFCTQNAVCLGILQEKLKRFEDAKAVLRHLQATGVNGIENKSWTKGDLEKFEKAYKSLCVKRPMLTYNPIYIKIDK